MIRKISALILLFLLLVVPFINWRLGAVLWMCAWVTYICQGVFNKEYPSAPEEEMEGSDSDDTSRVE